MENNYENLRMPELKALARERRLRGYSRLRKAELIAFLQNDRRNNELRQEMRVEPPSGAPLREATWEPEPEVPLTKRQLKCRRHKNSKLAKKFKNLSIEINNLKSQIEGLENKITKASQSSNGRFKGKRYDP